MSQAVSNKDIDLALSYALGAGVIAVLILESQDPHYKQTLICIERAMNTAKDRLTAPLFSKDHEKRFSEIITKIKKANLSKDEKLVANIPQQLELELSIYESLALDHNQWQEGWKPESLAFRYYNIFTEFRLRYQIATDWHLEL